MSEEVTRRCGLTINNIDSPEQKLILEKLRVTNSYRVPLAGQTSTLVQITSVRFKYKDIVFIILYNYAQGVILGQLFSIRSRIIIRAYIDRTILYKVLSTDRVLSARQQAITVEYLYAARLPISNNLPAIIQSEEESDVDNSENDNAEYQNLAQTP